MQRFSNGRLFTTIQYYLEIIANCIATVVYYIATMEHYIAT